MSVSRIWNRTWFRADISVPTVNQCVDTSAWVPPEDNDWPVFSGEMFVTGLRYDIGIFVGQHFVNQVLYAVWASEALCLDVSEFTGLDFTGDFASGFFGEQIGAVIGDKPVSIVLESRNPLNVEFSDDQPPIRIAADGLVLQTRGELLDRESLLQSVEMGADLGFYFDLQNSRLTMDVPHRVSRFLYAEEYFEIFSEGYSAGVPNLIDWHWVRNHRRYVSDVDSPKILGSNLAISFGNHLQTALGWADTSSWMWTIYSPPRLPVAWRLLGRNGGPTIDIDIDNIFGCDDTTIGCKAGAHKRTTGRLHFACPAGRVFGFSASHLGGAHSST